MNTKKAEKKEEQQEFVVLGEALGVIDSPGLLPMTEALDAMTKAANVQVLKYEKLGLGWLIIVITGSVGAVRAAMEAGHAAAERISKVGVATRAMARYIEGPSPLTAISSCMLTNPHPVLRDWLAGRKMEGEAFPGNALGYVEVISFATTVLVLDAMLKGADVGFKGYETYPPKYTLWVQGETGAVRYAVELGVKLATESDRFVISDVLARPEASTVETLPTTYVVANVASLAMPPPRLKLLPPSEEEGR